MIPTESIRILAARIRIIIVFNTALMVINSYAHQKIDLVFSMMPFISSLAFFWIAPLIIALFLSTRIGRPITVVLLGTLLATLVYNIVQRFTTKEWFTYQEYAFMWKIIYEGSFGLMLICEAVCIWLTIKLLQEIHKKEDLPVNTIKD